MRTETPREAPESSRSRASDTVRTFSGWPEEGWLHEFAHRIDQGLSKKNPFDSFKREIKEYFTAEFPDAEVPSEEILRELYECAMTAKVEQTLLILAKRLTRSAEWRDHEQLIRWVLAHSERLLQSVRGWSRRRGFLPDDLYREWQAITEPIPVLRDKLAYHLAGNHQLEGFAETDLPSLKKSARIKMYLLLAKECPGLKLNERAVLIRQAIDLIAPTKEAETFDAIAKALYRFRKSRGAVRKRKKTKKR